MILYQLLGGIPIGHRYIFKVCQDDALVKELAGDGGHIDGIFPAEIRGIKTSPSRDVKCCPIVIDDIGRARKALGAGLTGCACCAFGACFRAGCQEQDKCYRQGTEEDEKDIRFSHDARLGGVGKDAAAKLGSAGEAVGEMYANDGILYAGAGGGRGLAGVGWVRPRVRAGRVGAAVQRKSQRLRKSSL
jgi:hypothetical protein